LLNQGTPSETVVDIDVPERLKAEPGICQRLRIRFTRIPLPSGEIEILATSLIDKRKYPYKNFKTLYYRRWRIETFYNVLKSRLSLENFSGKSAESVRQDFHAAVFICGLESIMTGEAQEELNSKTTRYAQRINKTVSFNAIKRRIFEILIQNPADLMKEMNLLFLKNTTLLRPQREKPPRKKMGEARTAYINFSRTARKHAF